MTKPKAVVVRARVSKLKTDDGLLELVPAMRVGRTFFIDVTTIREAHLLHEDLGIEHTKELVSEVMTGDLLPLECLEIVP